MRNLILSFLYVFLFTLIGFSNEKPNIVVILTDDQGYNDLSCYGSEKIKTPRLDQMAKEGMKFTDFYVASPLCSASRAALLTGRYPKHLGVRDVYFPNRRREGLDPRHQTIAEALKTVGYATKAVGKWHLGHNEEFLPINQGFDSYYGIPYSNDMTPAWDMTYAEDCLYRAGMTPEKLKQAFAKKKTKPIGMQNRVPLMRNKVCIEFPADQSTITKRFTDESISFIDKSLTQKKPFFLYLAHSMPHVPLFASKDFKGKSARGLYGDVIEEIDFNVGRLLDHLTKKGINEKTLVVFTSDNGPWLVKKANGGSAHPLFEGKMTTFEGGQRVPAIIKWPGVIPAGTVCQEMASSMDLLPTFAHITGAQLQDKSLIAGKNILPLLKNEPGAKTPHEYFFFKDTAVRSGDWKYHQKEFFKVKKTARKFQGPTLYNLKEDIGESNNVIDQHPEIAKRLKQALDKFRSSSSNSKKKKSK